MSIDTQKVLGLNALQHIKNYVSECINEYDTEVESKINKIESTKQNNLVSGVNIKSINGETILGSGNIDLSNCITNEYIDNELAKVVKDVKIAGVSIVDRTTGVANIENIEFNGIEGPAGPQGPAGEDGKSVSIKGSFNSEEELRAAYEYFLYKIGTLPDPYFTDALTGGDAYLIDGNLWVYDGSNRDFDSSWSNVGYIKGETGYSYFKSTVFTRNNETPNKPEKTDGSWDDSVPEETDENGKRIWSDGIPEGDEILWATTRIFSNDIAFESDWSKPVQMTDTANFEVIYGIAEADTINLPPLPITEGLTNHNGWYDDVPEGVEVIWMATATCKNGTWSKWTVSKIKGEKGDTPIVKFKSIVFRRTNDILTIDDTPSGGDFERPFPTNEVDGKTIWSDGIPEGTEILWSSTCVFSNDGNNGEWTIPVQMTDTVDFEVIYSAEETYIEPKPFYRDSDGISITGWLTENNTWTDDGDSKSIWMATATCKNGVWSNWKISKIKGEDGKDGESTQVAYLDNPMDSVLLDANGGVTAGLPCSTNFYVYKGTEKTKITDLACEILTPGETGAIYNTTISDDGYYATFNVESLGATQNFKVSFKLTATVEDGKIYDSIFLINKISAVAPNIIVDLTNDNINIPCDADKNILNGYNKISNGINVFEGSTELTIDSVEVLNNTTPVAVEFTSGTKSFVIPNIPAFDDVLDLTVNVTFNNVAGNTITRTTSFRVVKVVPGANGEPAEFFELSPNFNTINVGIDNDGNQYIKNEDFIPAIKHVKGSSCVSFNATSSALNTYELILKYSVDENANKNSTTFPETGVLSLKNAITGDLDLDRYISLALIKNNEVIDFEKIYMIHDGTPGENGEIYKIIASDNIIRKDNTGKIKNTENIVISVCKYNGSSSITDFTQEVLNSGSAYSITKSINDGTSERISNAEDLIITSDEMSNISKKITYNLYYDRTGTDDNLLIDSVTISVIQDGVNGVDGKMMYFDGEFDYTKSYSSTDKALPYVYDDSGVSETNTDAPKYFYLRVDSYNKETTPYNDYMANKNTNKHSWEPITSMDVLYAKIGLFETANVGPAVFYKDWVFSQTDVNGGNSYNDFDGDPIYGEFKPAVWFNFKTGQGSLANGNISWDANGNVTFGDGVKLNWSDGINEAKSAAQGAAEAAATAQGAAEAAQTTANEAKNSIPDADYITNISKNAITTEFLNTKEITAKDISADKITGKTVQSGSEENAAWRLNSDGSGRLANGNIKWDKTGDIEFNGTITADQIESGKLKVDILDYDLLNYDNLIIKKLDTKRNVSGELVENQVRIQDNIITVTGNESNKPVLQVTGKELNEEFNFSSDYLDPAPSSITFTKPDNPINVSLSNSTVSIKEHKFEVGSINLSLPHEEIDNITSKIRLYSETGVPCTVSITTDTGDSINSSSLNIGFRCCVEKDNETIAEYKYNVLDLMITNGKFDNYDGTLSKSKQIYVPFDTICEKKYYGNEYTKKLYLVINKGGILGTDSTINVNIDFWGNNTSSTRISYYKKHLITEMPNMNIAKDGIRYFVDDYNYFNIDDDGYFTYYGPGKQYGFGVGMNGAWIVIGGKEFNVSNLNEQLKNAANSAIANNRNIKELETEVKGEDGNGGLVGRTQDIENGLYGYGGTFDVPKPQSVLSKLNTSVSDISLKIDKVQTTANDATEAANTATKEAAAAIGTALGAQTAAQDAIDRVSAVETSITNLNSNTVKRTVTENFTVGEPGEPISIVYVEYGKTPLTLDIQYDNIGAGNNKYTWVPAQLGSSTPGYIKITSNTLTQLSDNTRLYITNIKQGTTIYKPVGFDLIPVTKNINGSDVTTYSNAFETTVSQLKTGVTVPFEVYGLDNNDGNINIANINFKLVR